MAGSMWLLAPRARRPHPKEVWTDVDWYDRLRAAVGRLVPPWATGMCP